MVLIIEDVHQVCVERMDIVKLREAVHNASQLLIDDFLHVLDLAHVKLSDTRDLEVSVDLCRSLPLGLGEGDVNKLIGFRDLLDLLEIVGCTHYTALCVLNIAII